VARQSVPPFQLRITVVLVHTHPRRCRGDDGRIGGVVIVVLILAIASAAVGAAQWVLTYSIGPLALTAVGAAVAGIAGNLIGFVSERQRERSHLVVINKAGIPRRLVRNLSDRNALGTKGAATLLESFAIEEKEPASRPEAPTEISGRTGEGA
jgi:hypothetical protein